MPVHTISHGEIGFKVVRLEDCFDLAMGIQGAGKKWHSHVLSPVCQHNPYPGSYAIVIENDSDGVAYIAPSQGFPDVDKDLMKILHGDDILDPSKASADKVRADVQSNLLHRLLDLDVRGLAWHHHMHFPSCVLSPHRGKWAIAIESAEGTFSETYDSEPLDVLRQIEVIYFWNLDSRLGMRADTAPVSVRTISRPAYVRSLNWSSHYWVRHRIREHFKAFEHQKGMAASRRMAVV